MDARALEEYQRRWFSDEVIRTVEAFARLLWMLDRLPARELFEEFPFIGRPDTQPGADGHETCP